MDKIIKKSGVIPYFIENKKIYILLMKPSNPKFGGKEYQIAKGYVEQNLSLINTALKEGKEELGLKKENIKKIFFHRSYYINYKKPYFLNIYLCNINNKNNFDNFHYETISTKWFCETEIHKVRKSQYKIIKNSINKIKKISIERDVDKNVIV